MSRKLLIGCLVLFLSWFLPVTLQAQGNTGTGVSSHPDDHLLDRIKALRNLEGPQRQIAELLKQAIDPNAPLSPQEFFKQLAEVCGNKPGYEKPMVALNKVKSKLVTLGLSEEFLGPQSPLGGSQAEAILLSYRRDLTIEGIRHAVQEVARQRGGNIAALGEVFLAKIGKWAGQSPDAFTIAGDIDFTFLASDPETARALVEAFDAFVLKRIGMSMAQLDSVATAHGQATHLVYKGPQGEKYGDDEMVKLGRILEEILKSGVEVIDFKHPNAVGTRSNSVSGKEALETVLIESIMRELGPDATGAQIDAEFERRWEEKRNKTVEPFLSMELARHLEGDIIRQIDVFAVFDIVKKGSKYVRRSNDIFKNDFKTDPSNASWAKFVFDIDEMAAGRWPKGMEKGNTEKPTPKDIKEHADKFFKTQPDLKELFSLKTDPVELVADPEGLRQFLAGCQKQIWDNVSQGFDARIEMLRQLHNEPNEARRRALDEAGGRKIEELVKMLSEGLDAMHHEQSKIPHEVVAKAAYLLRLIESLPSTTRFKISPEELDRIRKTLQACDDNPNAQRLTLLGVLDKIGKWVDKVDKEAGEKYDKLTKTSEMTGKLINKTSLHIDAVNTVLDKLDNVTLDQLRQNGIIEFETGRVDAKGHALLDAEGKPEKIRVMKWESISTINERLNESIFGKIGNNTAFKAFNLANEGQAYYDAVTSAKTPGEAFQQLSTEFFRRRVPGGDLVEAVVMGQWGLSCVKVVYILFPTAAIPEALYGIAVTVRDFSVTTWWSGELELFVDGLYANADIQKKDPVTGKPTEQWFLHSIKHKGQTFTRAQLLSGNCELLRDEDFDTTLWVNLRDTDPFVTLMEDLAKHESAGQKVRDKFQLDYQTRWQKVKTSFVKQLIDRLEKRKAAEQADVGGEADKIYSDLVRIATELDINLKQVHAAMNAEWDSDNLKLFWQKVVELKRWVGSQSLPEKERTKAIAVVTRYRDGYRTILAVRGKIEEQIKGWYEEAKLKPIPGNKKHGLRLLTGINYLTGVLDQDEGTAARWSSLPGSIRTSVEDELLTIKGRVIQDAVLDAPKDKEFIAKIAFDDVWIKALQETGSRNVLWNTRFSPFAAELKADREKLIKEYEALYGGATRTLVIKVRQKITVKDEKQRKPDTKTLPLPTATVSLERDGKPIELEREDTSDFVARKILGGKFSLRASAPGFKTETGADDFEQEITVPIDKKAAMPAVNVVMVPSSADDTILDVRIDCQNSSGKKLSGDPITMRDNENLTCIARVTEKSDSVTLRFNWAIGGKVLGNTESTSVRFPGRGLAGTENLLSLIVIDQKNREGEARVAINVISAKETEVRFNDHRKEIYEDESETISVVEPLAPGMKYHWRIEEPGAAHPIVDHEWDRDYPIKGAYFVGKTLQITVTSTDIQGQKGKGQTNIRIVPGSYEFAIQLSTTNPIIDKSFTASLVPTEGQAPPDVTVKWSGTGGVKLEKSEELLSRPAVFRASGDGAVIATLVRGDRIVKEYSAEVKGDKPERKKTEKESADPGKAEKDRLERESAEKERIAKEKADAERAERDRVAEERAGKEKTEKEKTKAPAACSYKYSEWGECSRATKKQTRTVIGKEPAGCIEKGKPVLEQECTPPPTEAEARASFINCLCWCTEGGYNYDPSGCAELKIPGVCHYVNPAYGGHSCRFIKPRDQECVRSCYESIYKKKPAAEDLAGIDKEISAENKKAMKPLQVKFNFDQCPVHVQLGEVVNFSATIDGGIPPHKISWSGEGQAKDKQFTFINTRQPGTHNIQVDVSDSDGNSATATCQVIVDAISVEIEKTSPPGDNLPIGGRATFRAIVKSGQKAATGTFKYQWQPHPEVQFGDDKNPMFETTSPNTTAVYKKLGTFPMSVNVLRKMGDTYQTVGESNQIPMTIGPPKLKLNVNNKSPKIGDEVVITVVEEPKMSDDTIGFRWEIQGEAVNPGPVPNIPNSRAFSYKPKDSKPVKVTVYAKAKDGGDDLGQEDVTLSARSYEVRVSEPRLMGPKPRIWKEGVGLVEVERGIAVFQDVTVRVEVSPAPEKPPLSFSWSIEPSGCGMPGAGQEIRVNCSEVGTYEAKVLVKDSQGVELGSGSGQIIVTISQEEINRSGKAKEAVEKVAKAKELVSQGKLDEGITLAEEAAKLDPKNSEAPGLVSKWKSDKATILSKLDQAKKLIEESKFPEAQQELAAAKSLHAKYQPVTETEKLLNEKLNDYNKKTKDVGSKLAKAKELVSQGKLDEAITAADEASKLEPNNTEASALANKLKSQKTAVSRQIDRVKKLIDESKFPEAQKELAVAKEFHGKYPPVVETEKLLNEKLAEYNKKQKESADKTGQAQKLKTEGEALEKQGKLQEAASKYRDSIKLVPDAKVEEKIRGLEDRITGEKATKQTADRLWDEGKKFQQQGKESDALAKYKESLKHWASPEREKNMKDLERQIAQKPLEAQRLKTEGTTLESQGKLKEAIDKYRESLRYLPNKNLEDRIASLEGRLRSAQDKEAKEAQAKKLKAEGDILQSQGKLKEALSKYRESLIVSPDPKLEQQVRNLENQIAEEKAKKEKQDIPAKPAPPPPPRPATEEEINYVKGFAGKWNSTFKLMEIRVDGNKVSGRYTHDNGRIEAILSADGKTMEGTWSEAPSYKPSQDAGRVIFKLSEDGRTISGQWWYGQNGKGGEWTGTRVVEADSKKDPSSQPDAAGKASEQDRSLNSVLGEWKLSTGGLVGTTQEKSSAYQGSLVFSLSNGRLSGKFMLQGRWEELKNVSFANGTVEFDRPIPGSVQHYRGKLIDGRRLDGTFTHTSHTREQHTQAWWAQKP